MSRKLIILALAILIVIIVAPVTVFMLPQNGSVQPKTVIVDNLALTPHASSNHDFVKNATKILNEVGMDVDYFPLDDVTVNLYKNLGSYACATAEWYGLRIILQWFLLFRTYLDGGL